MNITQQPRAIIVWRFHEAPEDLRALSDAGGDRMERRGRDNPRLV